MKVNVHFPRGDIRSFLVDPMEKTLSLKIQINQILGYPIDWVSLFYQRPCLKDTSLIQDYLIKDGDSIRIGVNLGGP